MTAIEAAYHLSSHDWSEKTGNREQKLGVSGEADMSIIEELEYYLSHDWNYESLATRMAHQRDLFFLIVLVTTWRYLRLMEDVARLCEELDAERQRGMRQTDDLAALMVRNGD